MKLRVDGVRATGRALDVRTRDVDASALLDAIRDPGDDRVTCKPPGAPHSQLGHVAPNTEAASTRALALVADSLGLTPEPPGEPPEDPAAARRAVAAAEADVTALRERVERASGRLEARRAVGADTEDAQETLREATRALTEAETDLVAARQRLDAAERRLRDRRTARERRLERSDARRNHRERRDRELAERVRPLVDRARDAVPDWRGGALAAVRVARLRAPVVVEDGPFRHPTGAAACLDAPVVLV